jgi:hypothetical protein
MDDLRYTFDYWRDYLTGLNFKPDTVPKGAVKNRYWMSYDGLFVGVPTIFHQGKPLAGTILPSIHLFYREQNYVYLLIADIGMETFLEGVVNPKMLALSTGLEWCAPLVEQLFLKYSERQTV